MAPRPASQATGLPSKSTTTWDAYYRPRGRHQGLEPDAARAQAPAGGVRHAPGRLPRPSTQPHGRYLALGTCRLRQGPGRFNGSRWICAHRGLDAAGWHRGASVPGGDAWGVRWVTDRRNRSRRPVAGASHHRGRRAGGGRHRRRARPAHPTGCRGGGARLGRRPHLGGPWVRGRRGRRWRRRRAGAAHGDGDLDRHLHRAGQHDHHRAGDDHDGQRDDHDATAKAGHHDHPAPGDDHHQGADAQLRPVLPGLLHAAAAGPGLRRHQWTQLNGPATRPARVRPRGRRVGLRELEPTLVVEVGDSNSTSLVSSIRGQRTVGGATCGSDER
jgi:hypothetical protein